MKNMKEMKEMKKMKRMKGMNRGDNLTLESFESAFHNTETRGCPKTCRQRHCEERSSPESFGIHWIASLFRFAMTATRGFLDSPV
jgi:hypothetical protein